MAVTFKGKTVTREDVLAAIKQFNEQYPDTNQYESWLDKDSYKYAVKHEGKLYPPKTLLRLTTGLPNSAFTGGSYTNSVFERLDFEVVSVGEEPAPGAESNLNELFAQFRSDVANQWSIHIRRVRAAQIRQLLSDPNAIGLDTFNQEIWPLEGKSFLGAEPIRMVDEKLDVNRIAELQQALENGQLTLRGNYVWRPASGIFHPKQAEKEVKQNRLHEALTILNDPSLTPLQKAERIKEVPGFGNNAATGLVMLFHPNEFALYNKQSTGAFKKLGYPAETLEQFEAAARELKEQLGAEDFLELDLFLWHLNNQPGESLSLKKTRVWWVNQGNTYEEARAGGYLWAGKYTGSGKQLQHRKNITLLERGDIVLHNVNGALRAWSLVLEPAVEGSWSDEAGKHEGWSVAADYHELSEPIPLSSIPREWRLTSQPPFDKNGDVRQGYMFPLSAEFLNKFSSLACDKIPPLCDIADLKTHGAHIWLFQANPRLYNLFEALATKKVEETDSWTVTRYRNEMEPGDTVLLWQAGSEAGIYAVGEISGKPHWSDRVEWRNDGDSERAGEWRVPFHYTQILEDPLSKEELVNHPLLSQLQVIKAPQGTNFKVTEEEWNALQPLLTETPSPPAPYEAGYREPPFEDIAAFIERQGLRINDRTLRRYHLSLKTRGFVILSGISGTGKTWLTQAYADAVGAQYHLMPVAPNWTTNEDLLGYFSPMDSCYHHTSFSRFLEKAAEAHAQAQRAGTEPVPYHLVLDEMNLARVEYYFAKFLSAMEVRAQSGTAMLDLAPDKTVMLPPNLYFVGTINIDETTHGFADKVYDRAQLIELSIHRVQLMDHLGGTPYRDLLLQVWDAVHTVAPFAFRVLDEIAAYVNHAEALNVSWEDALDEQLVQKVLPKLQGTDPKVGEALQRLVELTAGVLDLSHAKAKKMERDFQSHGFASYF